jgi:nifR3 family TIM-barrel protein
MASWKIRDLTIANQVVIAPLAGISNPAFRTIAKEFGAGLVYSEMISDKAIVYKNKKTLEMCRVEPSEHPIALQLFGEEIETMVQAAIYLDTQTACDIIDINMGCPVPKVIKGSGGASLMKSPEHAYEIVRAIVNAVKKPVTVKIRIGWDNQNLTAPAFAKLMENAGASAIAVHGRTRAAMYGGKVNLEEIAKVKAAVSIPVIGNGDITDIASAREMLVKTNVDAIMVGRGILGNPWLIEELVAGLEGRETSGTVSISHKFATARKHCLRLIELKGEKVAMKEMRGHFAWYLTALPHSHAVKNLISQMTEYAQFDRIVKDYENALVNDEWTFLEKEV